MDHYRICSVIVDVYLGFHKSMKKNWQNIKGQNRIRVDSQAIGISLGGGEDDTLYRYFTNCQRRVSVS